MLKEVDTKTFWKLWYRYQRVLEKHCLILTRGDQDEAEEILCQGRLKMVEVCRNQVQINSFRAWAKKILLHNYLDLCRSRKRVITVSPDWFNEESEILVHEVSPESILIARETLFLVLAALKRIPPAMRYIFIMRRYQKKRYNEIARHIRITPANARKRMQKAKELFAENYRFVRTRRMAKLGECFISQGHFLAELENLMKK